MIKLGQFIYPWGNGHYNRMMSLDRVLPDYIKDEFEMHYCSKGEVYQKLLQKFPQKKQQIHEILMPTPIDGKRGPSITLSMLNLLLPVSGNPPLLIQISDYLKKEASLYNAQKFDLVINDGDMGSNVLSERRGIKSVFVTNQFRPKLWRSHFFFYPSLMYISKQIARATKIVVADSAPPNTICEYNLNFPDKIKQKVVYAGHFSNVMIRNHSPKTDLEKLIENTDFGYWMQTGNKATKEFTDIKYEEVFHSEGMKNKKRLVSHAQSIPPLERVKGKDGKTYSISDALEHNIDWIQIDVGFLSEQEKDTTLNLCKYAVINGSHTAMGEIIGIKAKPIIGIPVYDEHTNQIKWTEERGLGILANNTREAVRAVYTIQDNYNKYEERLTEFARNFDKNGAQNTSQLIAEMLES
ncbi:MAG TPA: glycosyltransferase [Nitrosopumilaceae archaeon]|nr:glycosyltransferase [Nitrosopumilaceae archaeon]